ncbi:BC1872 family protein [Paraliobacillus ryukyuensis]|uniref:BC1872 family protein n=1 Tax=Paraliobacillus ryukyuensis TaxID=200904 RepID=UPI0009A73AC2|nr:hypothetical protein [Paraliobacillus ryukyuensis]
MNQREIDRLVATEILGFTEHKSEVGTTAFLIDEPNDRTYFFLGDDREFSPSERIEDAWTVVDKLQEMKYQVQISTHGGTYEVECARYEDVCYFSQEERTVQLAICKIALEVAGFEESE